MKPAAPLPDFSSVRLLVAGDVMLDRYYLGPAERISPEAPVQVVNVAGVEERPGGAANVAVNASSLGTDVVLLGLVGDDGDAGVLERLLHERGVECRFVTVAGSPTIIKSRVMSRGQQLLRIDFEDGFSAAPHDAVEAAFSERLGDVDAVVLSDYAKGCLSRVERLIAAAREAGKPVFVDPKSADFSCYRGASVLTPNLAEFTAVAGACADNDELERKGEATCNALGLDALLVTRGGEGISLVQDGAAVHLSAEVHEVYDVTGAGDTVISVLAAAFCAGASLLEATRLANCAAGLVVEKAGTAAVSAEELRRRFAATPTAHGVHDEDELLELVAAARGRGESIVMTNGCFDILHAGHIDYLMRAAALGGRLIVAVNGDASVTRLKGRDRPINRLPERMRLLAALEAVDWVVPFSEDTPQRLIERVTPDVLVKGGDYSAEKVVGYDHVTAHGGEVVILESLEGFSTSRLIAGIRGDGGD